MVALIFLAVIAGVFTAVVAVEHDGAAIERRPAGFFTWIASGNWPAKIGGGLMIVGVGALLRYAAINFDVSATLKLALGIFASAALGFGSLLTASNPTRRAISLALGGAAFGVAYLTAYSAFAIFGYLPTLQGLGLLVLTAVGAGVFAVSRSALSLAVLSMVGAYLAPAFAVNDPGPQVVYLYYVAISVLTLAMVWIRGWRPLIHLSFLFTLAGGAFFAWTAKYFRPEHAHVLFPLLLALVAVHVAMPIVERRWTRGLLVESLDSIYLLALPVVAALTTVAITPSRLDLAVQLWWLGAIWIAASAWLYSQRREGMATHAIIGVLMLGLGIAARFRDLPWELVALSITVLALAFSARRSQSQRLHGFLAGLVLVLSAVHVLSTLSPAHGSTLFFNERFFERIIGAALMFVAARTLARLHHRLDSLMLTVAIAWAAFGVGAEVVQLDLVSAWLIVHWVLALAGLATYYAALRLPAAERHIVPLIFAIGFSALLAATNTSLELSWASAFIAGLALLAIAMRPASEREGARSGRPLAAVGVPIVVAIWIARVATLSTDSHWQFPLAVAAGAAIVVVLTGYFNRERSGQWFNEAVSIFAMGFAFVLAVATVFDIERAASAVTLELLCVGALILIANWNDDRARRDWVIPATVIGVALMLQANLLRLLGPAGELDALDVAKMGWPTLVSLLWASIGAALTIWGRRIGSRVQWTAGTVFLVAAAVKLLLLDFGSLGQLANILAVIAAGGVFLLVGWLAPMPPARKDPPPRSQPPAQMERPAKPKDDDLSNHFAGTVAVAAIALLTLWQCRSKDSQQFDVYSLEMNVPDTVATEAADAAAAAEEVASAATTAEAAEAEPANVNAVDTDAANYEGNSPEQAVSRETSADSACNRWVAELPRNYEVQLLLAGGDLESNRARRVLVDIPGKNVVLIFGTAKPVNWTVSASAGTNIVGVWLANNVDQTLSGVSSDTPVLRDSGATTQSCQFPADINSADWGAREVQRIFGRDPASRIRLFEDWGTLKDHSAVASQAAVRDSEAVAVRSDTSSPRNPWNDERLNALVAQGKLRPATMRDYDAWRAASGREARVFPDSTKNDAGDRPIFKGYVVLGAMSIPDGLHGAHAATFIVPRGVPRPTGDPGHSQILDMNR